MNKTGLIAKISIRYVLPTCIWKYFWQISWYFAFFGEFHGISRKYLNFAGPRLREISEALNRIECMSCMEILRSFLNVISVKRGSDPSCLDKEGLCPLDLVQLDSPFQIQSGGECTLTG